MFDLKPGKYPSQPKASSFFSLPIEIRRDIYKRVLVVPHPLIFFQEEGCPVESLVPEKPYAWLSLIYTNRQISEEARAVLYGSSYFTLEETEAKEPRGTLLESFLNCIGPTNARSLSRLSINFPATESPPDQLGEIRLREDGMRTLKILQTECTSLNTLETLIYGTSSKALVKKDGKSVREVLSEINSQLRGINSLSKILVKDNSRYMHSSIRDFLQGLGWTVSVGGI